MNKKIRIVVKVEEEEVTLKSGETGTHYFFKEVYSSHWKVDCINWIRRQDNPEIYKIYVEDDYQY